MQLEEIFSEVAGNEVILLNFPEFGVLFVADIFGILAAGAEIAALGRSSWAGHIPL